MYARNAFIYHNGEQINQALDRFPTAREADVATLDESGSKKINGFKAIVQDDPVTKRSEVVAIPTKRYTIVQHKDAFRPIVEGLTLAGVKDFGFVARNRGAKATLQLYTGTSVTDGTSRIQLAINCENSYDGSTAVNYGFTMKRQEGQWLVELVGYREVCSNGMKLIIPILTEADVERAKKEGMELGWRSEFIGSERLLHARKESIRHTASAHTRIEKLQYVTEALALLTNPVQAFINRMKDWSISDEKQLRDLVNAHVGKRYAQKVMNAYYGRGGEGERSLWGLYNAITYVASNTDIADSAREGLIDRAAKMPLQVFAEVTQ